MSIDETIRFEVENAVAPLSRKIDELVSLLSHKPDETVLSDDEAARLKGVSVSTLRRMKVDGRVGSIQTPKGRMVRKCDLGF